MSISFEIIKNKVILIYSPEHQSPRWLSKNLEDNKESIIRKTFCVTKEMFEQANKLMVEDDDESYEISDLDEFCFVVAKVDGAFCRFDNVIDNVEFTLMIETKLLSPDLFTRNSVNIFGQFGKFYHKKILYIVNEKRSLPEHEGQCIPITYFRELLKSIPSPYEVDLYKLSRYTNALRDFLNVDEFQEKLDKYLKRQTREHTISGNSNFENLTEYDIAKYRTVLDCLKEMLRKDEAEISAESKWQKEILKIFKILYPQYLYATEELPIKSFFNDSPKRPDIALLDFDGNIDLIEIKKAFERIQYKTDYRGNYIPNRELVGACLQLQNYLISLTKTDSQELQKLKPKFNIPAGIDLTLKAVTPKGYIICGRTPSSKKEKQDLQIIRQMFANIIDIVTYDDLVNRLENIIAALEVKPSKK